MKRSDIARGVAKTAIHAIHQKGHTIISNTVVDTAIGHPSKGAMDAMRDWVSLDAAASTATRCRTTSPE